jgi:carbon-monoxide dehydrogenase small subunit
LKKQITVQVNGEARSAEVEPRTLLVNFLRGLGLRGPKIGCNTTNCGACTVLYNGRAIKSCTIFAIQADGAEIVTVEGLSNSGELHPLQKAFSELHALQCGYCTPGFLMASVGLLRWNPKPSEAEIRAGLNGNLCMCTGYLNIIKAVKLASERMAGNESDQSVEV